MILPCLLSAQPGDLTHYEYWFDNNISARVIITINPYETLNLNAFISSQSLPQGLHTFHIRFKDSDQKYSQTQSSYFYHDDNASDSTNKITEYEYWIDDEYASKTLNSITHAKTLILDETFNFDSISRGLHTFNIRFKDYNQNWSQPLSKLIYKIPNTLDSNNIITEYEYWIDDEYASKTLNTITPAKTFILDEIYNFDSISRGLHTISIRFRDVNQNWSQPLSKLIYKIPNTLDSNNMITEYEYWIDDEYASKTLNSITPTKTFILDETYNFDSISRGLHTINFRFKDVNQNWSSAQSKLFYKIPNTLDSNNMVTEYEYWFDDNYSSKSAVSISPTITLILDEIINVDSIVRGLHTFHIRFKDVNQSWSALLNKVFYKQITVPTLSNDIVAYRYWFNNNELSIQYTNLVVPVNPLNQVLTIEIPDTLGFGTHQITLQFKDSTNLWSISITEDFIYTVTTQDIALNTGWNIMSFYVTPDTIGMIDIVQPLADSSTLIKVVNQTGGLIQEIPGLGWINTIGNMSNAEGYYIKMITDDTLVADGRFVDLPYSIPLQTGWNMMGYPIQTNQSAIIALQTLISNSTLIKVVNEAGGIIQNIPGVGWLNTIGNFYADDGYYIKVAANDTLILNETFVKATEQFNENYEGNYYVRNSTGNPYLPMHIVATFNNNINLFEGDELGVFINDVCIGSSYVIDPSSPVVTFLTTDDPTTEIIDGGKSGDIMTFKLFHSGNEYELQCENHNPPDLKYIPLETAILKLTAVGLGDDEILDDSFYVSEAIPNPMREKANIQLHIPQPGNLKITMIDLRGVVVKQLFEGETDAANREVSICGSNLNSGMYFILIEYKNDNYMKRVLRKVVLTK